MKRTWTELTDLERNRLVAYVNACYRRYKGFKSAQEDIDRLAVSLKHVDTIRIIHAEHLDEGYDFGY